MQYYQKLLCTIWKLRVNNNRLSKLHLTLLEERSNLSPAAVYGAGGINSTATGLSGEGVNVGQVEYGRPPAAIDTLENRLFDLPIAGAFLRDRPAKMMDAVSQHATAVASVIISNGVDTDGIARGASLYSSAYKTTEPPTAWGITAPFPANGLYEAMLLATQKIANVSLDTTARSTPVINLSWGSPQPGFGVADGSSLLSKGMDYIANTEDTLLIIAKGNSDSAQKNYTTPSDTYNGIVVGGLEKVLTYDTIWDKTNFAKGAGTRNLIDVVAPATEGTMTKDDQKNFTVTFAKP